MGGGSSKWCGMDKCFRGGKAESQPQDKPIESIKPVTIAKSVPANSTNSSSTHDEKGINGKPTPALDTPKKSSEGDVKRSPSKLKKNKKQKKDRPVSTVLPETNGETEPLSKKDEGETLEKSGTDAAVGTGVVTGTGLGTGAGLVGSTSDGTNDITPTTAVPSANDQKAAEEFATPVQDADATTTAIEPSTPSAKTVQDTTHTDTTEPTTVEDSTTSDKTAPDSVPKPPIMPLTPMTEIEEPQPHPSALKSHPPPTIPEQQATTTTTTTAPAVVAPIVTTTQAPPSTNEMDMDTPTPLVKHSQPIDNESTPTPLAKHPQQTDYDFTPTPKAPITTFNTSGTATPTPIPGSESGNVTPHTYSGDVTPHAGTGDVTPIAGNATPIAILGGAGLANLQNLTIPRRPEFDERSMTDESVYYSVKSFAS